MTSVPQRAMARYLRAQQTRAGPRLPPLPLTECADALGLDGLAFLAAPGGPPPSSCNPAAPAPHRWRIFSSSRAKDPPPTPHAAHFLGSDLPTVPTERWPGLLPAVLDLDEGADASRERNPLRTSHTCL